MPLDIKEIKNIIGKKTDAGSVEKIFIIEIKGNVVKLSIWNSHGTSKVYEIDAQNGVSSEIKEGLVILCGANRM